MGAVPRLTRPDLSPMIAMRLIRLRRLVGFLVFEGLLLLLLARPASAQEQTFTMAVRGATLAEALETFVQRTGVPLAYDPVLVRGLRAFCTIENAPVDAILRCLLEGSGLDFYRLSTGAYVLAGTVQLPSPRGFLAGLVLDRDSGAPLANAHVYLREPGLGSVTNDAGQFVFPPLLPGQYELNVSYLGYEVWRDTLSVSPQVRTQTLARLQPDPILITPVVVDGLQQRAPSRALGLAELDAALDASLHAGLAYQGMLAGLTALPGIRVHDVTSSVHLQGGESGDHQFRLDGVPVFMPRQLVGFVGPFNTFALSRITVHKAGFGASLGSHTAGVVAAEHALEGGPAFDVQVDPISVNARARGTIGEGGTAPLTVMAAARSGLGGLYRPAALTATLDAWTTPDLFLLRASRAEVQGADETEAVLENLPGLFESQAPGLAFTDLHGAARWRMSPLRTVHASLYYGRSRLDGNAWHGSAMADGRVTGLIEPSLTVVDAYDWRNALGQVRLDAVIGRRSLLSLQARGSRYQFDHGYQVLDTLLFNPSPDGGHGDVTTLSTRQVSDGNYVGIAALEGTLDHARGNHHLQGGLELARVASAFSLLAVNFGTDGIPITDFKEVNGYAGPVQRAVTNDDVRWWAAAFLEDNVTLSRALTVEGGVRLTLHPARATVYAEPRLALRYDGAPTRRGSWSSRTAAGLYRQFINEFDVSKLNVGALLPDARIWLPLDASVRPPLTYHLSQAVLLAPMPALALRAEAYYKYQPHGLTLRYLPADSPGAAGPIRGQASLLAPTRGYAYGTSVSAEWKGRAGRVSGLYEYGAAVRRSPALFGGRRQTVPWNEPHRLDLTAAWRAAPGLQVQARWQGVWGRSWGFRRAYYDYFGHSDATRYHGGYDLGNPSDHVLPALSQLDVGVAYARTLGPAALQVRLDLLNVLDRRNVADWRLESDGGSALRVAPRPLYPRIPSVALRISF